jgi:hypothetical protein
MIDDFLQIYFIFARFCEFQKLFKKIKAKELLKEGSKGTDVNEGRFEDYTILVLYGRTAWQDAISLVRKI